MKLNRVNQIQFLRFVAFLLLFVYHASFWIPDYPSNQLSGLFGLFFFLLLSGVMASYSLYQKEDIEPTASNIFNYFKQKLIKFYPLYFITNLLAVIYTVPSFMVANHSYRELFIKGIEFIATMLMCQTLLLKPYIYNAASWYVASLIWLSLLNIPFSRFSKRIMKKDKAIRKFVMIAILGIIYSLLATATAVTVFHFDASNGITAHPLIIGGIYITGMAIGNIVILIRENYSSIRLNKRLFTGTELAVVVISVAIITYQGEINPVLFALTIIINCLVLIVFMLGYGNVSKLFAKKSLVMLGNITFEAYLVHQVVIFLFANVNNWSTDSRLGNLYALSFCFVTSLVIAFILYQAKQNRYFDSHKTTKITTSDIHPIRKTASIESAI